ncbi:MAG: thiamine phosphate synthase [Myxococcota bacterium]
MSARDEVQQRIRGLYGIADGSAVAGSAHGAAGDPVALADAMLRGGCRLLQVRCKDWRADDVIRVTRAVVALARPVGATVIVNDDPEIALAAGADGVHLGQLDGAVDDARRVLGDGAIVGRSTGDPDALRVAVLDADYVAFGPVWSTPNLSRPKEVRGLDGLRAARAVVPVRIPLVAIGGITADRRGAVVAAGASAWAVIGAIAAAPDPEAATRALA